MEKRTREILALVLLVVLGVGIGCAMAWYILVGHNWNVAATHIDDYVGEMEGYTVIVYEGTTPMPVMTGVGQLVSASMEEEVEAEAKRKASASQTSENEDAPAVDVPGEPVGVQGAVSSADGGNLTVATMHARVKLHITAEKVAKSYREKDAEVLVIDSSNIEQYRDPQILKRGDKRIGVFSFGTNMPYLDFVRKQTYLKRHDVDYIVSITDDRTFSSRKFHGADVVIFACNAFIPSGGTTINNTFCADSPNVGEVEAVIIAPSNMITSKAIAKL